MTANIMISLLPRTMLIRTSRREREGGGREEGRIVWQGEPRRKTAAIASKDSRTVILVLTGFSFTGFPVYWLFPLLVSPFTGFPLY